MTSPSPIDQSRPRVAVNFLAWALFSGMLLCGCGDVSSGTGPGKRIQRLALAPNQELAIGREAMREIRSHSRIIEGGAEVEQVERVGGRIAKAIQIKPLQREINLHVTDDQFEWEYAVVEGNQINAFCLPGGKIVVFSGLLKFVRDDDQLAVVISHEVAHALAHHVSERIARERTVGHGLLSLAYNREQESEADHIGIFLMTFAGYDPNQAEEFWKEMLERPQAGLHLPEILSDHPNDERRMEQIQAWIRTAQAGKSAFDAGRIANP